MKKEKVYIVVSHKHQLKKGRKEDWEVAETVEFVNQLRNKHLTTSSAIGDYINQKMMSGARFGMTEYSKFESYVRGKYAKEMAQLDAAYKDQVPEAAPSDETVVITDQFGNTRPETVFDKV